MVDGIFDAIGEKRKFHATMSTLPRSTGWTDFEEIIPNQVPPPAPPLPANFNSKVRLEPAHMRDASDGRNLPHVDSVVQPGMRELNRCQPESDEIANVRARLRPIASRTTDVASLNVGNPTEENVTIRRSSLPPPYQSSENHSSKTIRAERLNESQADTVAFEVTKLLDHAKGLEEDKAKLIAMLERTEAEKQRIVDANKARRPHALDFLDDDQRAVVEAKRVNQMLTEKNGIEDSTDVYRQSRLDKWVEETKNQANKPNQTETNPRETSPVSILSKKPGKKNRSRPPRTRSQSGVSERSQSLSRSMKSVLFHLSDAEERRSETDSDDVTECVQTGDDYVKRTADKLLIHGPYVDDELNVFHELCHEYMKAARYTFAQRSYFSRTRPAYERVYALIGSNRRTKWLNRRDWNAGSNEFKLLDYAFRKTIRSKSQKITNPGLNIEHFTVGRTLGPMRFRIIMMMAFERRDELLRSLVGESKTFTTVV